MKGIQPRMNSSTTYLLGGLLLAGLLTTAPASAQTALIAHRSHSGTVRTFRPGSSAHNFGLPASRLEVEKIVWLRGARAVRYGRWVSYHGRERAGRPAVQDTVDLRELTGAQDPEQAFARLRAQYPKAQLLGFSQEKMRLTWPQAQ